MAPSPWPFRPLAALLLLASSACRPAARAEEAPAAALAYPADHHMHLGSADLCARLPAEEPCGSYRTPLSVLAEDAVRALDAAHVGKGMVFSAAYLYGLPEFKLPPDSVAYWMRRENEFTAAEVAKAPDRLVGMMSVDPLAPAALDEIARWRGSPLLRGLKMHLFANKVDVRDPAQRDRLGAVFQAAGEAGMPIVVHVGGAPFGAAEAGLFLREVLPRAGGRPVQVAHGAGGGLPPNGPRHVAVLRAFADQIVAHGPGTDSLYFDLSYFVWKDEDAAAVAQLLVEVRRIGVERFFFASDFDVQTVVAAAAAVDSLPLTPEERAVVARSCAPWVCGAASPAASP
ncbi:MAG: amidohydrolase family protein [Gemmatimonadetes bacterium]|nr:amidohydrolase family protein [Gemmatimonadota bacterium]